MARYHVARPFDSFVGALEELGQPVTEDEHHAVDGREVDTVGAVEWAVALKGEPFLELDDLVEWEACEAELVVVELLDNAEETV